MKSVQTASVLAVLMLIACAAGFVAQRVYLSVSLDGAKLATGSADSKPHFSLADTVPKKFGDWQELPDQSAQVITPETKALLDKLYSQVLNRTYVNASGYRIMLSLAYGNDQLNLAMHMPEICYPGQGFELREMTKSTLATLYGEIPVNRLDTKLGRRVEPVTYWFTIGDASPKNKLEQYLLKIKFRLTGRIPDGLLFRVSSLDERRDNAYPIHDAFVSELLGAVNANDRQRLSGLQTPSR